MLCCLSLLLLFSVTAFASLITRQDAAHPWQKVPESATTPDNKYAKLDNSFPASSRYFLDESGIEPPNEYQSRPFDMPFSLLNFGTLNFFKNGQFPEEARSDTDPYDPNVTDFANNSACGIPDNAYWIAKVAIHPYWLKFAPPGLGLSRYCMQDACLSVWNETGAGGDRNGTTDVEFKITDICSTDADDPSYCETPADIMVDRRKAMLLYNKTKKGQAEQDALKTGKEYPHKVYWFFSKCLQDGLPQRAYNHSGNWFATPPLPQNTKWSLRADQEQWRANVLDGAYSRAGLPTYEMGAYITNDTVRATKVFPLQKYWKPGDKPPDWCPVAGGKGHTKIPGICPVGEEGTENSE
ncbi:MAG: hypothetical protein LQ342_003131 [Letrouitia transgressa]|nr:MAG: hypothetical protein LQ342_003131 [Letrouitia transgressa]